MEAAFDLVYESHIEAPKVAPRKPEPIVVPQKPEPQEARKIAVDKDTFIVETHVVPEEQQLQVNTASHEEGLRLSDEGSLNLGKRSNFERIPRDKYLTTDPGPVRRLQAHLPAGVRFVEPCAGKGDLIKAMVAHGHECAYACDIKPQRKWIERRDAFTLDREWRRAVHAKAFITNPPWTRAVLHEMIIHLSDLLPTWLLLDADWMHTEQAFPYVERCAHVVAVGRVRWIPGTNKKGYENAAWFYFPRRRHTGGPRFTGLQ